MSQYGLMIDYEYCSGCQSCELACKNEHGFPQDKWGIKMVEFGPFEMEPGVLEWNYLPYPTKYCDLCAERVARGDIPTCQLHCLAGVMSYDTVENLALMAAKKPTGKLCIFIPEQ